MAGVNLQVEIMVDVCCQEQSSPLKGARLVSVGSCEVLKGE